MALAWACSWGRKPRLSSVSRSGKEEFSGQWQGRQCHHRLSPKPHTWLDNVRVVNTFIGWIIKVKNKRQEEGGPLLHRPALMNGKEAGQINAINIFTCIRYSKLVQFYSKTRSVNAKFHIFSRKGSFYALPSLHRLKGINQTWFFTWFVDKKVVQ